MISFLTYIDASVISFFAQLPSPFGNLYTLFHSPCCGIHALSVRFCIAAVTVEEPSRQNGTRRLGDRNKSRGDGMGRKGRAGSPAVAGDNALSRTDSVAWSPTNI